MYVCIRFQISFFSVVNSYGNKLTLGFIFLLLAEYSLLPHPYSFKTKLLCWALAWMCVGYPPEGLDEYEMEFCSCFVTYHYVWCMIPSWLDAFGTLLSYMKRNKSLQKKTTTLCSSLSSFQIFERERDSVQHFVQVVFWVPVQNRSCWLNRPSHYIHNFILASTLNLEVSSSSISRKTTMSGTRPTSRGLCFQL